MNVPQNNLSKDKIKESAAGREIDILEHVAGIPAASLDGKHHPCQKCGGTDRFRLVDAKSGAILCNQCFTSGNGDFIAAVQHFRNVDFPEALRLIGEYLGVAGSGSPSPGRIIKPARHRKKSVPADLEKLTNPKYTNYNYVDEQGIILFQVVRVDGTNPDGTKGKRFFQRQPDPADSKKWVNNVDGVRQVPYRLPEILKPNVDALFVVEGEKDANRLNALLLDARISHAVATTSARGAKNTSVWKEFAKEFKLDTKRVFILPDNDEPGMEYARNVAQAIFKVGMFFDPAKGEELPKTPKVKIVELPDLPGKGDFSDWADRQKAEGKSANDIIGELQTLCDAEEHLTEDTVDGWGIKIDTADSTLKPPADTTEKKQVVITSDLDYFAQFASNVSNPPPRVSTGFLQLDKIIGGGLRPGLYTFGAIPSLGKTTFAIQLADFIAESGRDVLYFTLEMSRDELIAKSLSRITASQEGFSEVGSDFRFAKTATEILDNNRRYTQNQELANEECRLYGEAQNYFAERIAQRRFVIEPPGRYDFASIASDVESLFAIRKKEAGTNVSAVLPPIVFVDYLQIIQAGEGIDLRLHMDETALALKYLSRKYRSPVFTISSFNRASYRLPVSYESFKESGSIEYQSDFTSGLNPICVSENRKFSRPGKRGYDPNLAKSRNPRIVELFILKNRFGEPSGEKGIFYEYFPAYNLFREIDSDSFEIEMESDYPSRSHRSKSTTEKDDSNQKDGRAAASGEKDDEPDIEIQQSFL